MLILARKVGQHIVIGTDIEITVVEVRGDQVRLGIAAPRSIPVHRKELLSPVTPDDAQATDPVQTAPDPMPRILRRKTRLETAG